LAYQKQNFIDGMTLYASQLEAMENAIIELESRIGGSSVVIGEVTLLAANWTGTDNLYSQEIVVNGIPENFNIEDYQVDLTPSVEQLAVFYNKDLTFVTENIDGVVTVYAIGQRPANDYTIQVTLTEVST
jgi:hypothetical protein